MKVLKIFGLTIIVLGFVLVIASILLSKGDFTMFKNAFNLDYKYEKVEQSGQIEITDVQINVRTNVVNFYRSEDESYKVTYYESEDDKFDFSIVDGKLVLKHIYKFRFFNWGSKSREVASINIYLPNNYNEKINATVTTGEINIDNYQDIVELNLKVTTGEINLQHVTVSGDINFSSTTGEVNISYVNCNNIIGEGTTGEIEIRNSEIVNNTNVKNSTGEINVIDVTTKSLITKTTTGTTNIIRLISDNVETTASTGNTKIVLVGKQENYKVNLSTSTGYVKYQDVKYGKQLIIPTGEKTLNATTSTGNIIVSITE